MPLKHYCLNGHQVQYYDSYGLLINLNDERLDIEMDAKLCR